MTVKYYTDEAGTKKIVLKEGRVSCSCCGLCQYFDIENLLYVAQFRTEGVTGDPPYISYNLSNIDVGDGYELNGQLQDFISFLDQEEPPSFGQAKVIPGAACLRFLCRDVIVDGGTITSETNTYIGGPTTNNKDLWEDICFPRFGDESESGTYLYVIEFWGWRADWGFDVNGTGYSFRPRYWKSSDENGLAWKIKVTREEVA